MMAFFFSLLLSCNTCTKTNMQVLLPSFELFFNKFLGDWGLSEMIGMSKAVTRKQVQCCRAHSCQWSLAIGYFTVIFYNRMVKLSSLLNGFPRTKPQDGSTPDLPDTHIMPPVLVLCHLKVPVVFVYLLISF